MHRSPIDDDIDECRKTEGVSGAPWPLSCCFLGDVAQLAERSLCKADVVGSIPIVSTRGRQQVKCPETLSFRAFLAQRDPLGVNSKIVELAACTTLQPKNLCVADAPMVLTSQATRQTAEQEPIWVVVRQVMMWTFVTREL